MASLSDVPPVQTDEIATDMTTGRKSKTTVAFDYGAHKLAEGATIHLYGTPGQERFSFMWDILTEGGSGLVLLLDNSRSHPFRDLIFFLGAFEAYIARSALVVGVTHFESSSRPSLDDYQEELARLGYGDVAVFAADPRCREDVAGLIASLISANASPASKSAAGDLRKSGAQGLGTSAAFSPI